MRMTGLPSLTGVRLLLAEDDDDLRHELASVFHLYGAVVESCVSGNAALRRLRHQCFDIVVSDLEMPDGDGFSLAASIRESAEAWIRELPVAAVSVRDDLDTRRGALEVGFDVFVSKLASITTIIYAIARIVPRMSGSHLSSAGCDALPSFAEGGVHGGLGKTNNRS